MYSAAVADRRTLFIPLLLQAIRITQKYMMYPKTLAKSLSLRAFSAHFIMSFISSNFSPYPLVDNTCIRTLYISFRCTDGAGASIVFDNSLTILLMSGLLCFVR